jgi:prevent-host-death family protein
MKWQLRDPGNDLSKIVRLAKSEGPQTITSRGKAAAVVISADEYERLARKKPSLAEFILSGPVWDDDLVADVNRRSKASGREVDV